MNDDPVGEIVRAKKAAIEVLLHNMKGPFESLPRTAGWGYPEPYTRDLMISSFGIFVSGNEQLVLSIRKVLDKLAKNQSKLGHIPGLVHDPEDRGASDTTPLFLICLAMYRNVTGDKQFLMESAEKALLWLQYQSPDDTHLIGQQPTSDWRDEQWVLGYGLYVSSLVYMAFILHDLTEQATLLKQAMNNEDMRVKTPTLFYHEGLAIRDKPFYALWAYKVFNNERFDLLGNSLVILTGIASETKSAEIIAWAEKQCEFIRDSGDLVLDLPPCLFPYMHPGDSDWHERYKDFNLPGEYHNGGVWPFVCAFYILACFCAGEFKLAEQKLLNLTNLIKISKNSELNFGFNEWFRAQDGSPRGQDWQTWSAAMYLYASTVIEERKLLLLEKFHPEPVVIQNT